MVCLWALITLSILSAALANFVFTRIKFTNFFIRSALSLSLAKAACQDAFYERKADNTPEYDSEKELSQVRARELSAGAAYKYYFTDEGARININTASSEILARLPGLDEALAKAIVESPRRQSGFKVKEEAILVEGVSKERFIQFKDLVTVYGGGRVNINTASAEVLSILGLSDDLIQLIMRYRREYKGADGEAGTADDGVFDSGSILEQLREFTSLSLGQEQELYSALTKNLLGVKSAYLRLKITPEVKGKPGTGYFAIIHPEDRKIAFWSEEPGAA